MREVRKNHPHRFAAVVPGYGANVRRVAYLLLALCIAAAFIAPPDWLTGSVIFLILDVGSHLAVAGLVAALLLLLIFARFIGRKRRRWTVVMIFLLTLTLGIWLADELYETRYADCDDTTQELNGGPVSIGGSAYDITLCQAPALIGRGQVVRLLVKDSEGQKLARRYFLIGKFDEEHEALRFGSDAILYQDQSADMPLRAIQFPPSLQDWIMARLPFAL